MAGRRLQPHIKLVVGNALRLLRAAPSVLATSKELAQRPIQSDSKSSARGLPSGLGTSAPIGYGSR